MKKMLVLCCYSFLFFISFNASAQNKDSSAAKPKAEEQIRKYWFVMLLKGPNRTQDSATAASIQKEHLANINRLYNEGKIKVAGPFGDRGDWLGIFIFDPYPFGLLTMIVSLEAIFLSCFVLVSQNRQAEKDRVRSDIEYEVNIKAELEITHLHEKTDRIYENMMARFAKLEKSLAAK